MISAIPALSNGYLNRRQKRAVVHKTPQQPPVARIAHHNDCLLASETDYGTYERGGQTRAQETACLEKRSPRSLAVRPAIIRSTTASARSKNYQRCAFSTTPTIRIPENGAIRGAMTKSNAGSARGSSWRKRVQFGRLREEHTIRRGRPEQSRLCTALQRARRGICLAQQRERSALYLSPKR